jgi:hypothetical protein
VVELATFQEGLEYPRRVDAADTATAITFPKLILASQVVGGVMKRSGIDSERSEGECDPIKGVHAGF